MCVYICISVRVYACLKFNKPIESTTNRVYLLIIFYYYSYDSYESRLDNLG